LYLQVVFDTLLITAIVHITSDGGSSPFAPLYILNIAAGALLLPLPGGVLVGGLASALYFADAMWLQPQSPTVTMLLQIGVFAVTALLTGNLGDRLRAAGTALGAAESELRQLRLDTSEILATIDTGLITVDGAGRLVHANGAALQVLQAARPEDLGPDVLTELDRRVPGLGAMLRRGRDDGARARGASLGDCGAAGHHGEQADRGADPAGGATAGGGGARRVARARDQESARVDPQCERAARAGQDHGRGADGAASPGRGRAGAAQPATPRPHGFQPGRAAALEPARPARDHARRRRSGARTPRCRALSGDRADRAGGAGDGRGRPGPPAPRGVQPGVERGAAFGGARAGSRC